MVPPFDAGSPRKAGETITKMVQDWVEPLGDKFAKTCEAATKDMDKYAPKK